MVEKTLTESQQVMLLVAERVSPDIIKKYYNVDNNKIKEMVLLLDDIKNYDELLHHFMADVYTVHRTGHVQPVSVYVTRFLYENLRHYNLVTLSNNCRYTSDKQIQTYETLSKIVNGFAKELYVKGYPKEVLMRLFKKKTQKEFFDAVQLKIDDMSEHQKNICEIASLQSGNYSEIHRSNLYKEYKTGNKKLSIKDILKLDGYIKSNLSATEREAYSFYGGV